MDDNIGATSWGIHFTDTYRYSWRSPLTTSQVVNAYISELIGLYSLL